MRLPPRFVPPPFVPARGLASPHAQTIFAHLFRPGPTTHVIPCRWELADGDFLDVDRLYGPRHAPCLLVFHGLEGSSRAGYVASMLRQAELRRWSALAVNFRSCGRSPNRLARSYHAGDTSHVREAVTRARAMVDGPLVGVGFSLGGNVLLDYLAEVAGSSDDPGLAAAAAVSVPFELAAAADALDRGRGLVAVYRQRFLHQLRAKALAKTCRHPGLPTVARIRASRRLRDFDDVVTAPLAGFSDAAEYYDRCSSGPRLGAIRVPTLLLSAADDPLVPVSSLPVGTAHRNPWIDLVMTERGGHVGFVSGSIRRPRFWGEEVVARFLDDALRVGNPAVT